MNNALQGIAYNQDRTNQKSFESEVYQHLDNLIICIRTQYPLGSKIPDHLIDLLNEMHFVASMYSA